MIGTRAGFLGGGEVVEVTFDPQVVDFAALLAAAREHDCATAVWTADATQLGIAREAVGDVARPMQGTLRADAEPKYYAWKTALRHLPMTGLQAARVNATLHAHGDEAARALLSPRQRELLAAIEAHRDAKWPDAIDREFVAAWHAADAVRASLRRD